MKSIKFIIFTFVATLSLIVIAPKLIYADGEVTSELGSGFDEGNIAKGDDTVVFQTQYDRIWSTAILVSRIAAFAGIFILGLNYIFASADKKADLKKGMLPVVIGIAIFFGSTFIINFIKDAFQELIN